jgi:hypothetical protein
VLVDPADAPLIARLGSSSYRMRFTGYEEDQTTFWLMIPDNSALDKQASTYLTTRSFEP